jgi:hypothetical protein
MYIVTTKWQTHNSTKVDRLNKDFKALNKFSIKEYATTAHVIFTSLIRSSRPNTNSERRRTFVSKTLETELQRKSWTDSLALSNQGIHLESQTRQHPLTISFAMSSERSENRSRDRGRTQWPSVEITTLINS